MKNKKANYLYLASELCRKLNKNVMSQDIKNARLLCMRVKRLDTYNATDCNRELTKDEIKRRNSVESLISDLLEQYGLKAYFNGDPRGYPVKLSNVPETWKWRDMGGCYYVPFSEDLK